jgi:outer membrane protein
MTAAPLSRNLASQATVCLLLGAGVLALTPASATAQSTATSRTASQWALGAGVAVIDKAYRDFDRETRALPVIAYENKWISAAVPTLDVKLFTNDSLSLRLRARWAGDGYEAKDSPVLRGMDERKASVWGGGALVWKTGVANLSAEVLADTMSKSKGLRGKVQIDRRSSSGKFGVTPRVAVEWFDKKYVDYYYGVRASEATAGRATYAGTSTTSVQAGVRFDYAFTNQHMVFADFSATRFGSAVKDSPLVDKPNQATVGMGYIFRF